MDEEQLRLADPQLAVALLGTLRQDLDVLIDELDDASTAKAWSERAGMVALRPADIADLRRLRDDLRVLLTAVVHGEKPDGSRLDEINSLAADAPVTLAARITSDGTVEVQRTSPNDDGRAQALADVARSALALLVEPTRSSLRLCDAPNCVRFFLKQHSNQEWCSPACGNRARVARHYARHRRTGEANRTSP